MKLTVVISEMGAACNIGGPITYRRITVDLTAEQAQKFRLADKWDSYGTTFLELDDADRACVCANALGQSLDPNRCHFCGKEIRSAPSLPPGGAPEPGEKE